MYMTEKYRSYGTPPREIVSPLQITSVLATAVMLLGGACLGFLYLEKHPLHSLSAMIWLLILFVAGVCAAVGYFCHTKDARFTADETCVTFTRMFCKDKTIYYRDIDTISVYNSHHSGHGYHGNSAHSHHRISFYVETMLIITLDGEEHYFRAIMDFAPSARIASAEMMNKMFDMGKLSILKKFIEAREVY